MKKKGTTEYPEKGDKVWRELKEEDIAMGKGANGSIVQIDWSADPREYVVIFPPPTDKGTVSRETYTRDDFDGWTDRYQGTWYIGDLP